MRDSFECENSALYHDLQDQNRYPFRSVPSGPHHGQPGYSNHIFQQKKLVTGTDSYPIPKKKGKQKSKYLHLDYGIKVCLCFISPFVFLLLLFFLQPYLISENTEEWT